MGEQKGAGGSGHFPLRLDAPGVRQVELLTGAVKGATGAEYKGASRGLRQCISEAALLSRGAFGRWGGAVQARLRRLCLRR